MKIQTALPIKIIIFGLVIAALLFFGGISYYSINRLNRAKPTEIVVQGKAVWKQKSCVGCHTILGGGSYLASDLTHAISESSPETIQAFLVGEQQGSMSNKPHPVLSAAEAEAILHFLIYVDQLNIRDTISLDFLESLGEENEDGGKDNSGKARNSNDEENL